MVYSEDTTLKKLKTQEPSFEKKTTYQIHYKQSPLLQNTPEESVEEIKILVKIKILNPILKSENIEQFE